MSLVFCTLLCTAGYAQDKMVAGIVTDVSGLSIPGVNVTIKGKVGGVSTDLDGKFNISVATGESLVFSYLGFKTKEIKVGNANSYTILLDSESATLDEVVVVGYGTKKKSDVTGSIVSIGSKELESRPIQNAIQGMQGKAAGVDISSNERPGTVGAINIRGVRSVSASNSPLYVVDGIPINSGGIDFLNPTDIESIDVLKDASATAIYGSRGANGVIIVSTKKGKSGKLTMNYNTAVTVETLQENARLMNAGEYIEFRRWAKYYAGATAIKGNAPTIANDQTMFTGDPSAWANIAKGWSKDTNGNDVWSGTNVPSTNWMDFAAQTGVSQQHTLSVSGGTEKMKAYGSFGYLDNTGTLKGQSYRRYNGTVSVDIKPNEWFSMGANLNTSYGLNEYGQSNVGRSSTGSSAGIYNSARANFAWAVPFDSDGNRIDNPGGDAAIRTVVDEDKYSQDQRVTLRAFGSFYGQFNFGGFTPALKGLKYRVNFGPDITAYRNGVFLDAKSAIRAGTNFASLNKQQTITYTLDHLLLYDKTIGKHDFGVTLLQSQTEYHLEENLMQAINIADPRNKWNALTQANVSLNNYSSGITDKSLLSYMGRLNYSFNDKYLLTASGRFDGASQLAPGNKWAFFPSTSLAWRIDKEDFLQGINWLSQLKLRAGVGVTGNSSIDPYQTQPGLAGVLYPFGSTATSGQSNPVSLGNVELTWEKTTQYNYGIDFGLFNNKISGSLEYYTSKTNDLLLKRGLPTVDGFTDTYANVGATAGNGVELTLNTINVQTKDFEWSSSFSGSYQQNHIVTLANGKFDDIGNNWFIGQSQNVVYGYASNGIWKPEDAAEMALFNANGNSFSFGNARPLDQNGDHKIDANNDRVIIGSTDPKFVTGLTNTFKYKDLELSIFLYGRMGYLYNTGGENEDARYNQRAINYYTDDNTNAEYQKPIYSAGSGDAFYGTLGYRSGSFLKIRNISLGYNLPSKLSENIGISKMRFYVQATNPGVVFSKVKWTDLDTRTTASNRGFTIGLNVEF